MEFKGSKTEKNLMAAFAGESQARNKYTYYASKAKKEGYEQIAAIFLETAENEKEHAKLWFKEFHGIGPTTENLTDAAAGERDSAVEDRQSLENVINGYTLRLESRRKKAKEAEDRRILRCARAAYSPFAAGILSVRACWRCWRARPVQKERGMRMERHPIESLMGTDTGFL